MTNFTSEQQAIIDFVADSPDEHLMVSARAGSGKTFTIEHAAKGIDPSIQFLAVAFNKRIAAELAGRLPAWGQASTLNSLGHRAWGSKTGMRLKLDADKVFNEVKKQMEVQSIEDPEGEIFRTVLALVRGAKSNGLVPKGAFGAKTSLIPDEYDSWDDMAFERGFDADDLCINLARKVLLIGIKDAFSGTIDFDDQLYMSALFGGQFKKHHTVIVDEAQDLSALNHLILEKLVRTRLIAVGDPYQAIYGFRGAAHGSMDKMVKTFGIHTTLTLSYTFRCSTVVAERQVQHVPDFKAHESCLAGLISRWPIREPGATETRPWSIHDVPKYNSAILCRNNAPLMRMAFCFIKERRPVKILGRDIGASLAVTLKKIVNKQLNTSTATAMILLDDWRKKEIEKCGTRESKKAAIEDRYDCIKVLLEASECENVGDACEFIETLFADNKESGNLILATGHKAKGLEWDWVMHLDPWRVPSKFAKRQFDAGNPAPMEQEKNLRYVIETRTRDVLVLANLDDCGHIEEKDGDSVPLSMQEAG